MVLFFIVYNKKKNYILFQFLHTLGVPKDWEICDVFGFGSDELAIVPRPVASVIMLFPDNDAVVFNFYFYGEKPLII